MFWLFVAKELKSIVRDPKLIVAMIIIPLVFLGIFYFMLGHGIRQQIEEATKASGSVAVIDIDRGSLSKSFISYLKNIGLSVKVLEYNESKYTKIENIISIVRDLDVKILYIIPIGFSHNLSNLIPAKIYTYVKLESLTVGESGIIYVANSYINYFGKSLVGNITKDRGIPISFIDNTVLSYSRGVLNNKLVEDPQNLFFTLTWGGMFMPLVIIVLISLATQLVATSIAVEKEEKMFETLLSLPLSRMSIIGAKLFASILISLVFMILYSFMVFGYMFTQISASVYGSEELGNTMLIPSIPNEAMAFMITNIIGLTLFMMCISLLLGLFAEDVRSAQAIVGNLSLPMIILVYSTLFLEISSPITKIILSAIPMANTVFLPKLLIIYDPISIALASVSNIVYSLIMFIVIRRIVNTETIFTLRIRRKRREVKD